MSRDDSSPKTNRGIGEKTLPYLNLGCGTTFDLGWVNMDLLPSNPEVIAHDLYDPLPFGDGTFEMVYHSHVLEHLHRGHVRDFLLECRRVLKPGGTVRIVVPDLERLAKSYLACLEGALAGDPDDARPKVQISNSPLSASLSKCSASWRKSRPTGKGRAGTNITLRAVENGEKGQLRRRSADTGFPAKRISGCMTDTPSPRFSRMWGSAIRFSAIRKHPDSRTFVSSTSMRTRRARRENRTLFSWRPATRLSVMARWKPW
jgi:SAM-dependent methyltransferase